MIDLILAFMFGWLWGSSKEEKQNEQRKLVTDCPLSIETEDGQSFGYLKNKDEDLR